MTTRNLKYFFEPKSVALIGASAQARSVGAILIQNLVRGKLDAPVYPVNPRREHVFALPAYPDIARLPQTPDLAVVATPPKTVPGIISELGAKGTKATVVITAGFSDGGEEGKKLKQEMLDAAQEHLLRVIGPNCLGIMAPHVGLNASFAQVEALPGRLAFLTQSGAVATAVVDWAHEREIGFSHMVSLGDMSDVDFGDMLDYLAVDRTSRAILMYVEAVKDARKFMSAARAAARAKPVIVVKVGRSAEGAKAAASHTGSMAGSDAVYDAAFRRAGVLRVSALDELFDAAETLSKISVPKGDRLAILTNGGGAGVLAADWTAQRGGRLAEFQPETLDALDKVLPPNWSHGNPVDIIGDAPPERYDDSLKLLLQDRNTDAVLVLCCPTAMASGTLAAEAVIKTAAANKKVPVLTNWLGGSSAVEARRMFADHGVPTYETPHDAVRAFTHLVDYRRGQIALEETPPSIPEEFVPDTSRARTIIEQVLNEGRDLLTEPEAKEVLRAYEIATTATEIASTPEEARELAAKIDGPVVIKILSRDITHKSDVGGVVLDLETPADVEHAAVSMLERVARAAPDARVDGIMVQQMLKRRRGYELIVGVNEDAQFGPTILFGQGGTGVEVLGDVTLGLPPLNLRLAREMVKSTRIYQLLKGFRHRPPIDMEALELVLVKVSQLAIDLGEIKELDINPLLADENRVAALDARIRVEPYEGNPHRRLAIKPYPKELEETVKLKDGRELLLRPIRGEDEPALQAGFEKLTPEEIERRFFGPMKSLDHLMAARLSQINYDREMALILADPGLPGKAEIFAVARISAEPDHVRAEYAILVRHELAGQGLGTLLLTKLFDYAKGRGIAEVYGAVLSDNRPMLRLCEKIGFRIQHVPDDPSIVMTTISLN